MERYQCGIWGYKSVEMEIFIAFDLHQLGKKYVNSFIDCNANNDETDEATNFYCNNYGKAGLLGQEKKRTLYFVCLQGLLDENVSTKCRLCYRD